MPDYTSILRRSLAALPDARPDMREAVYQRARAALARQLTAVDPPLSSREIERQHQELETAVSKLESEFGAERGATGAQADPGPKQAAIGETGAPKGESPPRDNGSQRPANRAAGGSSETRATAKAASEVSQPQVGPSPAADRSAASGDRNDRRVGPVLPRASKPRVEPVSLTPPAPAATKPGNAKSADADHDRDYEDDDLPDNRFEAEERSSRAPLIAVVVAAILVVAALAAYGVIERERVMALLGAAPATGQAADATEPETARDAASSTAPTDAEDAAGAADAEAGADSKLPDRLTNGSETQTADGEATEPGAESDGAALNLPADEEGGAAPADLGSTTPPVVETPETSPSPTGEGNAASGQTAALEPPAAAADAPSGSIVAQKAIYYFQGAKGEPGEAKEGTVAWSQTTQNGAPAVRAILRMNGQDATTTVTIYKNNDSTLPASHLVEIQFSGKLSPSPVQRVPALVMKQTEQARGQPLIGAAVPVTADLFWIALSDDAEQVKRNLQIMRDGSWFDVPVLFNDGTRALLTFEKGIPGDKIFETVLAAWTPS